MDTPETKEANFFKRLLHRLKHVWRKVVRNTTVEPLFFILCITNGMAWGSGALDKLELWKACVVGVGYNDTVCDNLRADEFNEQETVVQTYLNNFMIGKGYINSIPKILIAVFAGSLSDRIGRKPLIITPLIGWSLWLATFAVHCYYIRELPMEFLYVNVIFKFFGNISVLYMGIYGIATDVTKPNERAQRMLIFAAITHSTYFLGTLASPQLFKAAGYVGVILVRALGLAFGLLWAVFYLKETRIVAKDQKTEKENDARKEASSCWDKTKAFLDKYIGVTMRDFFHCLTKARPGRRRLLLYLQLGVYTTYLFCGMYYQQVYLYLNKAFPKEFSMEVYANYQVVCRAVTIFSLVVIIPLFLRKLKFNETTISLINSVSCFAALTLAAFARNIFPEYVAAMSLGSLAYSQWSLIRTTSTKTVGRDEVGKVFSAMALLLAIAPSVTGNIIKKIYNATMDMYPAVFLLTAAGFYALATVLNLALFLMREEIEEAAREQEEERATEQEQKEEQEEDERND